VFFFFFFKERLIDVLIQTTNPKNDNVQAQN